ncbi:DUF4184 family protein [Nocardiopsis algeriensis]|uniref:DUF4184 family protein n=1 Tax=Nocardiopsis algeriensis TaxID=1478215 RepID=UPI003B43D506
MPFTPSHAAAVLPLVRVLPPSALVVGAVAPDLPYYVPVPVPPALTHSPFGLGADVLLGACLLAVYLYALRAPLHALAGLEPPAPPRPGPRGAALAAAALAAGSATHMLWDSFTQTRGALVQVWPLLSTPVVGPHLLYNVLMYASSALGLAAVLWWAAARARAHTRGPLPAAALAAVAACALGGTVLGGLSGHPAESGYDLVRAALVGTLTGTALGLAAWSALWWARRLLPFP